MNILKFTLFAVALVVASATQPLEDKQPKPIQHLDPILESWWIGLNASKETEEKMGALVTGIMKTKHEIEFRSRIIRASYRFDGKELITTVPVAFYAYYSGLSEQKFVQLVQWMAPKAEDAARVFAIVLRILMHVKYTKGLSNYKWRADAEHLESELEQHIRKLLEFWRKNQDDAIFVQALRGLIVEFYEDKDARAKRIGELDNSASSAHAATAVRAALEKWITIDDNNSSDDNILCDFGSNGNMKDNVARGLYFALLAFDEDAPKKCMASPGSYPSWLYELSNLSKEGREYNKKLHLKKAECAYAD